MKTWSLSVKYKIFILYLGTPTKLKYLRIASYCYFFFLSLSVLRTCAIDNHYDTIFQNLQFHFSTYRNTLNFTRIGTHFI